VKRLAVCALGLVLWASLAGCGDGKGSVQGTVTLDGQPVATGSVTFVKSEGGRLVREGAVIQNGSFRSGVPPGKYAIEVNGQKVVGKRKHLGLSGAEELVDVTEELFPAWYNTKTELTAEITSGANTLKLDLRSKK
jgi:hypothetical protein